MKPKPSTVSVQVNVTVDGEKVTTAQRRQTTQNALINPRPFSIVAPATTGNTPIVFRSTTGINYVEASGASLSSFGIYPTTVFAKAFSHPNESPLDPANWTPYLPDWTVRPGIVSVTPNADGTWAFLAGTTPPGNAVPGAAFDSISNGLVNSTLLVWYEYDYEDGQWDITVEAANFHGYLPGSSGGGSNAIAFAAAPAHLPATKLVVTFTGALSALGPVKLIWNGVSWVGIASHGGGSVLALSKVDQVYQLQGSGPAASFMIAGCAASFRPFSWTTTGTAVGNLHGFFKVTITE